jgi:hypothetical protein
VGLVLGYQGFFRLGVETTLLCCPRRKGAVLLERVGDFREF